MLRTAKDCLKIREEKLNIFNKYLNLIESKYNGYK